MSVVYSGPVPLLGGTALQTSTTGDKATIPVPFKCRVEYVWALVNTASAHATAFVLKFDKRPTAGSDTGRGDGDVGVLSKTASASQAGKMLYERPSTHIELNAGDQVIAEVTTANGDACLVDAGVVVEFIGEKFGDNSDYVAA